MRIMGGVSGTVMSRPKERNELWGRELQVEGTAYAKSSRWKRAWVATRGNKRNVNAAICP